MLATGTALSKYERTCSPVLHHPVSKYQSGLTAICKPSRLSLHRFVEGKLEPADSRA